MFQPRRPKPKSPQRAAGKDIPPVCGLDRPGLAAVVAASLALALFSAWPDAVYAQQSPSSSRTAQDGSPGLSDAELGQIRSTLAEDERSADIEEMDAAERDPEGGAKTPFRIGIVPRGDPASFLKRLEPMRAGLSEVLAKPVEILPMTTFSAMIDAHSLRRIDLGFYSASAFVTADRLCRCLEPLVVPMAADGTSSYYAIIVARSDSGLRQISDLQGKHIVASSIDSVAGYRIQMASMMRDNIDVGSFFGEVETVGSSMRALRDLRDGFADAAFIWSSISGQQSAGYSRGPMAFLVQRGELDMNQVSIIWQSRPIAHGPVAGLKSLAAEDRKAVTEYLLAMSESDTAMYDILDVDYGGGYRAADIADFRGVGILADVDLRALGRESLPTGEQGSAERKMPMPRARPDPAALVQ